MQNISTCLWFNDQAEEAAGFYVGLFPNSCIVKTNRYLDGGPGPVGSVLTVQFRIDGTEFVALNGGPVFQFSPAISLVAYCDTQEEVDHLWRELARGGQTNRCGWLTDKFGVSWQVVPRMLPSLVDTDDRAASQRAVDAMMKMTKLDIGKLQKAYDGA